MKLKNLMAIGIMGIMLATAFSGCIGGKEEGASAPPEESGTNETITNQTNATDVPSIYLTNNTTGSEKVLLITVEDTITFGVHVSGTPLPTAIVTTEKYQQGVFPVNIPKDAKKLWINATTPGLSFVDLRYYLPGESGAGGTYTTGYHYANPIEPYTSLWEIEVPGEYAGKEWMFGVMPPYGTPAPPGLFGFGWTAPYVLNIYYISG